MQKIMVGISFCLLLPWLAQAQQGSAEGGYYPMDFHGDTWTGIVSARNDETREVTLSYQKRDKIQTFVGVLEQGYKIKSQDGTDHVLKVSEIPLGLRLKVYYIQRERKVEGRKVKYNEIFRMGSLKE